jgi:hypothetical protein
MAYDNGADLLFMSAVLILGPVVVTAVLMGLAAIWRGISRMLLVSRARKD